MSGFFGFGAFRTGTILGNLLAKGGFFGPNFRVPSSGGGTSVTFQLTGAGPNSHGPYTNPPCSMDGYASGNDGEPITPPSGFSCGNVNTPPVFVNGQQLVVFGNASQGPQGFWSICLPGVLAQNFFTSVAFQDAGGTPITLLSAAANFNSDYNELPGYTVWTWPFIASFPHGSPGIGTDIVITW